MSDVSDLALSVLLGTTFAAGVVALMSSAPRWSAPGLESRIAPYIRDVSDPAGTTADPDLGVGGVLRVVWSSAIERFGRILGGTDALDRRLAQAGVPGGAVGFRARQLVWAVAGMLLGGVLVVALALLGRGTALLAVVPPLCALGGALACDMLLQLAARRRIARLQEELPAVLEFLSLCLAAGEGLLDAIRRVSTVGAGDLAAELRTSVLEVGTGSSLSDSLTRLSRRLALPALGRAVDQLVASMERGAPLARVLQAQADDAREDAKRVLIEKAGRSEIWMLLPRRKR